MRKGGGFRRLIELCGRHPLASGGFALLGGVGLLFSFFQFGFDQIQANRNERENRDLRASVERVERSLAEIAPVEEPVGFIPLLARSTSAGRRANTLGG